MSPFVSRAALVLLVACAMAAAPTTPAGAGDPLPSPFDGMSQRDMWCQVLGQGIMSPARKAHAREECFGKLARFDKVTNWQGEVTLKRRYSCADESGIKTVRARFGLKRTPYVSQDQLAARLPSGAAASFRQGMTRMQGAQVVIRRDPTTGFTERPNQLSWILTQGRLNGSISVHGRNSDRSYTEHGSGSAAVSKQARLIFDLERDSWSLELSPVEGAAIRAIRVTSSSRGTTSERIDESLDDLNSLDGYTVDQGRDKLPGQGLQLVGHLTSRPGRCVSEELSWRLTPAADCGAYKDLEAAIEAPDSDAHWVFDTKEDPGRFGPYRISGDAWYNDHNKLAHLGDMLEWTLPDVAGVTRRAKPKDLHGSPITITYLGMPPENSAFGKVSVTATIPKLLGCLTPNQKSVKFFFARDGRGNPKGKQEPNWFYYWLQTKAGGGHPASQVVYEKNRSAHPATKPKPFECVAKPAPTAPPHHACDADTIGYFLTIYPYSGVVHICDLAKGERSDPNLYHETTYGIDTFGLTVDHEFIHKRLYEQGLKPLDAQWYRKLGDNYWKSCAYDAASFKVDPDADGLTTAQERKYGLDPKVYDTHCTGEGDNEYLAYTLSSKHWKLGSADKQDWACPGRQCGGVAPSPGGGHWPGCPVHKSAKSKGGSGLSGGAAPKLRSMAASSRVRGGTDASSQTPSPSEATGQRDANANSSGGSGDDAARIAAGLQSKDSMRRLRALRDLAASGGGATPAASAARVVDALASEVSGPAARRATRNAYLPQGAWRRVQYARLSAQLPQKALAVIYRRYSKSSGPMKVWLAITLGDAGDVRVTSELVNLLRQANDWPTRWAAVEALGAIGSPEAVAALKGAMEHDAATVTVRTDGTRPVSIYPVREQAAGALQRLGFKVRLVAPNTYTVAAPKSGGPSPSVR